MGFAKKLAGSISVFFIDFFALLVMMRVLEFLVVGRSHHLEGMWMSFFESLLIDLKVALALALVFGLFNFLLRKWKVVQIIIVWVPLSILVMVHLGLIFYFTTVLEPLDKALLQHSFTEMKYVLREFGDFEPVYLLILLGPILLLGMYRLARRIHETNHNFRVFALSFTGLSLLILCVQPSLTVERGDYKNFKNYYLVSNKSVYFLNSVTKTDQVPEISPGAAIEFYQKNHRKDFVSENYPLLRKKDEGSVLAPYFKQDSTPPNFVFIIVESLSARFSGEKAKLSFTPFLDSLSGSGLFFESFLSNGERTFSVLPSTLASLPHGKGGFTNSGLKMPRHESIPKHLIERGYSSAFFYGGYAHYSFYDTFMEMQGIDKIYERSEYNYEGTGKVLSEDDIPFGVDDGEMFQSAIGALDSIGDKQPYLHTYLTLSMHYPFKFGNQEYFVDEARKLVNKSNLPESEKEIYKKYDYVLSSMLYTDNSLQAFFEDYRKRPEFENTIFLIYGDHRISGLPFASDLDVYHVPLLIYSPLLKGAQKFPAVNSHLDIPPSILALLESNYGMELPDTTHWIGSQFDTSSVFQSKRRFGMMLNNRNIEQYIFDDYFYSFGNLYEMQPGFQLSKTENDSLAGHIKSMIENDQIVGEFAIKNNRITQPDSKQMKSFEVLTERGVSDSKISFGSDTEYEKLLSHEFSDSYDEIQLTLNLPWFTSVSPKNTEQMPLLVISLKKKKGEPLWSGYKIEDLLVNDSERGEQVIMIEELIRSNRHLKIEPGDELSVYFWNNKKPDKTFTYQRDKVRLMGVPK